MATRSFFLIFLSIFVLLSSSLILSRRFLLGLVLQVREVDRGHALSLFLCNSGRSVLYQFRNQEEQGLLKGGAGRSRMYAHWPRHCPREKAWRAVTILRWYEKYT